MSKVFQQSLFLLLVLMTGTLASCQREESTSVPELSSAGEIGFTVNDGEAGTKSTPLEADYFRSDHYSFNVVVYKHAEGAATSDWELFSDTQTCDYNDSYGIWKPSTAIGWPMTEEKLTFIAYAPSTLPSPTTSSGADLADGEVPFLKDYTVPAAVADQVDILLAVKESSASPLAEDLSVGLRFTHALSFVKFSIGQYTTCSSITLSGIPGTGTLDMSTGEWSSVGTPAEYTIDSPTFGSVGASRQCPIDDNFTLMLIPQTLPAGATLTAETSAGTITVPLAGQVWEAGKTVTYRLTAPAPFPFSVSATKTVRFSPGNLQAVFAEPGNTFTWRFAENQWDRVGKAAANTKIIGDGTVSTAGPVDLFCWSTAATTYGIYNSRDHDYFGAFVDWGTAPGLAEALGSGWRTLSSAEWTYLLETRDGDRYCKATVNSVYGLVIFPDDYSHPSGVTAPDPASVNTPDADYKSNSWSETDWTAMEDAGCVFLPAAGFRNGSAVTSGGSRGYYWSSAPKDTETAYSLGFAGDELSPEIYTDRDYGYSVRLVQNL